jgi:ATP-dependent Clp protease protease subunit
MSDSPKTTHRHLPEQGKVYIGGIDKGDGALVGSYIEEAASKFKGKGPIQVHINSGGGNVLEGFQIIDTIRHLEREVMTIAHGQICSMAIPVLASGDKRYASSTTLFMTHEYSNSFDNKSVSIIEARMDATLKWQEFYAEFMAERTGKTKAFWKKIMKTVDHWFDAEKALEYGLIHEIRTPKKG